MNITGFSKSQLFLNKKIPDIFLKEVNEKIKRLELWEPIEYILKQAEFYWMNFYVNNNVLIPRNDTEIMIDCVLENLKSSKKYWYIDVWTWSSCIPISILKSTDKIDKAYVVDISEKALEVSKVNIKKHNLENKIIQIKSDLLEKLLISNYLGAPLGYHFDKNMIITANLPYIKQDDFENIDNETMEFEPALALYWWEQTWFELYEKLIKQCFELKNKWHIIILFIEIWFDQYDYSKNYLKKLWLQFEYYKDNWGIWRCVKIKFWK